MRQTGTETKRDRDENRGRVKQTGTETKRQTETEMKKEAE